MNLYRQRAGLLKLLAHPVRLRILDVLRCDAECVCHLSAVLDKPQPYVSQQLAVLRTAGVIVDVKDGSNVFYQLVDSDAAALVEAALGPFTPTLCRNSLPHCPCPKCRPAKDEGC